MDCSQKSLVNTISIIGDSVQTVTKKEPKKPPHKKYLQKDFRKIKNLLKESGDGSAEANLYEHIKGIVEKVVAVRPNGFIDNFEKLSLKIKHESSPIVQFEFEKEVVSPDRLAYAYSIIDIFRDLPRGPKLPKIEAEEEEEFLEEEETPEAELEVVAKDLMQKQFYWNLSGLGVPGEEVYILTSSVRKLKLNPILETCRFWGKIMGLRKNYLIVEATLTQEEIDRRLEGDMGEEEEEEELPEIIETLDKEELYQEEMEETESLILKIENPFDKPFPPLPSLPPLPKEVVIPAETYGVGTNKYVYFVTNYPGDDWVELPLLTPKQIQISRQITKYLSGDLNAEIYSFPKFPGLESSYLRAVIARITASTYISPEGYYKFDNGDEELEMEEDEENASMPIIENTEYEPLELSDASDLTRWQHHRPYLLKQGRIFWFDPSEKKESEEEEEEEAEEEEGITPEVGPPMFSAVDTDCADVVAQAWDVHMVCTRDIYNTITLCKSRLWPGAFAFACGRLSDCMYYGFGVKAVDRNYSPPHLPGVLTQYPIGPEIMEIRDPTVEEEEAWRLAHLPKEISLFGEEEMGEEEFLEYY